MASLSVSVKALANCEERRFGSAAMVERESVLWLELFEETWTEEGTVSWGDSGFFLAWEVERPDGGLLVLVSEEEEGFQEESSSSSLPAVSLVVRGGGEDGGGALEVEESEFPWEEADDG